MRSFIIGLLLVTPLFSGCTETSNDEDNTDTINGFQSDVYRLAPDQMPDTSIDNILSSHHDFSFAAFQRHIPADQNSVISPFDTQQFLTMLALGSAGKTQSDLSGAANLALDQILVYEDISVWEQTVEQIPAVERTSYLWGQSSYLFSIDFLTQQAELFGPVMSAADFLTDNNQVRADINATLDTSFYFTDSRTRLVSAQKNSITSVWSSSLLATAVTARFGGASDQQWVDMVKLDGVLDIHQGSDFKAVQVPFEDSGLALMIIIPNEGHFSEVSSNLSSDGWNQIINNLSQTDDRIYIPNFIIDRELMAEDLPALNSALSDTLANFSPVNNTGFLYLQQPGQNISLVIDETGINALTKNIAVHQAMENEPEALFSSSGIFSVSDVSFTNSFAVETPGRVSYKDCFYSPDQSPFIFAVYDVNSKAIFNLGHVKFLQGQTVLADWEVIDSVSCGDQPPVEVYKYKGSLQCEVNSGEWYGDMQYQLSDSGIEVLTAREAYDNLLYPAVCGGSDGVINIFGIRDTQINQAKALGFGLLSELP